MTIRSYYNPKEESEFIKKHSKLIMLQPDNVPYNTKKCPINQNVCKKDLCMFWENNRCLYVDKEIEIE